MKRILITGATGNIGREVIRFLFRNKTSHTIVAGVREVEKSKRLFAGFTTLEFKAFDFENPETFDDALAHIDSVFLLRPPALSDVDRIFRPLIEKVKSMGIKEVVFLSVQGAEKSKVIPHNKIERLIKENGLAHVFIRPGYFMQNLTTTLISDIQRKRKIILPAGKAKFNWIDVDNIGETAAVFLEKFELYKNQAIEVTGTENEDFYAVADQVNQYIADKITYRSVNPLKFYFIKKKDGLPKGMILVMIMLHFLPRFQKAPRISGAYEKITGKRPTLLREFIEREKAKFAPQ